MNFLNKKTRLKLVAQALTVTSIVGMHYGTKTINVSALETITANDAQTSQELLIDATEKVSTSELTRLQSDVNIAQLAIDILTDGKDKYNLQVRLNAVQDDIDNGILADAKLTNAINAVSKAESTTLQSDIDSARTLVESLPDSTIKSDLTNRLDVIDAYLQESLKLSQAKGAVSVAESTKSQIDVTSATILVNNLTNSAEKEELLNKLQSIQVEIDVINKEISTATDAVVKAETTGSQLDVDYAKNLVNSLPNGTIKVDLTGKLDTIQESIDLAKQIENAKVAVTNAETTKVQSDVDSARDLVNKLPEISVKTELSNRLDVVQAQIDKANEEALTIAVATEAVIKAEASKIQEDVTSAKKIVDSLNDSETKTDLTNRLAVVQAQIDKLNKDLLALKTATSAVVTAEKTEKKIDLDYARDLVEILPDGSDKIDLSNRLDAIQVKIDKNNENNENNENNQDNSAIEKATEAVVKAETSKTQEDLDSARDLVTNLTDSETKVDLSNRLDIVQAEIEANNQGESSASVVQAIKAVIKAEFTQKQTDVDSARVLVNSLKESKLKSFLTKRLDNIQKIIDKSFDFSTIKKVTEAVAKAEKSKKQSDIDEAKEIINSLPDSNIKTELLKRLDTIETSVDNKDDKNSKKLKEAEEAVIDLETNLDKSSCKKAIEKVTQISSTYSDKKSELYKRINKGIIKMYGLEIKDHKYEDFNKNLTFYLNIQKAKIKVETLKNKLDDSSCINAIKEINKLPNCKERDDLLNSIKEAVTKASTSDFNFKF